MDFFRNAAFGMDNGSLLNLIQLHTGPFLVPKYKDIRNGGMEISGMRHSEWEMEVVLPLAPTQE